MTTPPIRRTARAAAATTLATAMAMATMTAAQPATAAGPTAGAARRAFTEQADSAFQNECLTALNAARAKHQAPPLTVDPELVTYARARAQKVSQPGGFNHDGLGTAYGELLDWGAYLSDHSDAAYTPRTCKESVDVWYGEIQHYDFGKPGFTRKAGNFTQLVWKSTTKVGCARVGGLRPASTRADGDFWFDTYIACDFTPPGNSYRLGQEAQDFAANVLPAVKS
ncbi:CAP family protein [Kitasatospora sp. NPDC002543]